MTFNTQNKARFLIFAGLIIGLIGFTALYPLKQKTSYIDVPDSKKSDFDAASSLASQFGPAVTEGRVLTTADMTTSTPLIPSDIYRPSSTSGPNHRDLATFAWLEFISLASPKSTGAARGETGGSFATSGKKPNTALVWESYQHRSELFPYIAGNTSGRAPDPWDQAPSYKMSYKDASGNQQMVDIPYNNYNNLDETTQIGMNILYFPVDPNTMDPDKDFQVLFEAKVNQQEWSFVNSNYTKFTDFNTNFPDGINFDSGTIEVKATWRPLSSIPTNDQYRYHTTTAIYYTGEDDDPKAVLGQYALIGLHIIHKTPNFPTFIFATFEHEDNLKTASGTPTGLYYVPSYEKISYSLPTTTTTSNPTATVPNPTYPSGWLNNPYAEPSSGNRIPLPNGSVLNIKGSKVVSTSIGNVYGVPVTQPATTNADVNTVNSQALKAMQGIPGFDKNFVWQYYFLKGVQGVPTDSEESEDYYLANIVTESSVPGIQLFTGGQGIKNKELQIPRNQANVRDAKQGNKVVNQGGCLGCHGIAQTGSGFDFSFLYFSKTSGFSPDVHGLTSGEVETERVNKYMKMLNPKKNNSK